VILALRSGPTHLERGIGALAALMNSFTFLYGSVVLSHSTNWSSASTDTGVELTPVEWNLRGERQHVDQRIGDEDPVGVAGTAFMYMSASAPDAPPLERDDHRLLHQAVLLDGRLHHSRHLVGRAAGTGGDDDLHRLCGLPGPRGCAREHERKSRTGAKAHSEQNNWPSHPP